MSAPPSYAMPPGLEPTIANAFRSIFDHLQGQGGTFWRDSQGRQWRATSVSVPAKTGGYKSVLLFQFLGADGGAPRWKTVFGFSNHMTNAGIPDEIFVASAVTVVDFKGNGLEPQ